jgi:hypothetical protein
LLVVTTDISSGKFRVIHSACASQSPSTITGKFTTRRFAKLSTATQRTLLVPFGKYDPEGGSHDSITFVSQLSEAVTEKFTRVPLLPSQATFMLRGAKIVGAVLSRTITLNEQLSVRTPSDTYAVTVFVPNLNVVPGRGL